MNIFGYNVIIKKSNINISKIINKLNAQITYLDNIIIKRNIKYQYNQERDLKKLEELYKLKRKYEDYGRKENQ